MSSGSSFEYTNNNDQVDDEVRAIFKVPFPKVTEPKVTPVEVLKTVSNPVPVPENKGILLAYFPSLSHRLVVLF